MFSFARKKNEESESKPVNRLRSGYAVVDGVKLFYEDRGEIGAPAVILVMGLGAQMTIWPESLCDALEERGFRVIRLDNRDVGLSSEIAVRNLPNPMVNFLRSKLGLQVKAPYTLRDMAADVVGLMEALELPQAHLVGASMGGMIVQLIAALCPQRVASLTSIMSNTNEAYLPTPDLKVLLHLSGARGVPITDVETAVQNRMQLWELIRSPAYPSDPQKVAERAASNYQRSFRPQGAARHSLAVMATGGFSNVLGRIQCPSLVIHGNADPLVPLAGGQDSARAIPGAKLKIIDGMGHEIPESLAGYFAEMIADNAGLNLG